jgi:RNA polymerase sigma-70 factor (ECF subfamily)
MLQSRCGNTSSGRVKGARARGEAQPVRTGDSMPRSDIELMTLAACADRAAQRQLVQRLIDRVQKLAHTVVRNPEDAGDASQASLMEILRFADTFRGETSLERWADEIVLRTSMRAVLDRRDRARTSPCTRPSYISPNSDPTVVAHQYLSRLTRNARTVLVLREIYEYSLQEIAELTGVSPNTAKDRLVRAREALRNLVRREGLRSEPPRLPGR